MCMTNVFVPHLCIIKKYLCISRSLIHIKWMSVTNCTLQTTPTTGEQFLHPRDELQQTNENRKLKILDQGMLCILGGDSDGAPASHSMQHKCKCNAAMNPEESLSRLPVGHLHFRTRTHYALHEWCPTSPGREYHKLGASEIAEGEELVAAMELTLKNPAGWGGPWGPSRRVVWLIFYLFPFLCYVSFIFFGFWWFSQMLDVTPKITPAIHSPRADQIRWYPEKSRRPFRDLGKGRQIVKRSQFGMVFDKVCCFGIAHSARP